LTRISHGQKTLQEALDAPPTVFVPPWNRYDANTVEALARSGLACVSANRYGPSVDSGLFFLPTTASLPELRGAVTFAREIRDLDPIIGVLLHPYDFKESGDARALMTCAEFGEELRWLAEQEDVTIRSISDLIRRDRTLTVGRYRANQPLPFESSVPPFIRSTSEIPVFRAERKARVLKGLRALGTIATYIGVGSLAWAAGRVALRLLQSDLAAISVVGFAAAAFATVLARSMWRREAYFRTVLALAVLAGLLASGCASLS
jgi:hypothetical protein